VSPYSPQNFFRRSLQTINSGQALHYKSFSDLAIDVGKNLHKLPTAIDLVVGIPRSGMLAASMVALHFNCRFCDVDSYVTNRELLAGDTRTSVNEIVLPQNARNVLVIDDSVWSGAAIGKAKQSLAPFLTSANFIFAAVYVTEESQKGVDVWFDVVPTPRIFEWNLFHRSITERYCVDIDGVLCLDPSASENDDGDLYRNFLLRAPQLARPSHKIGHLVTSRLERFRSETEEWLASAGVRYGELHMLDLPSALERRRLKVHASFKASVYSDIRDSRLFIESDSGQAQEIARRSGKPVLDFGRQVLVTPGMVVRLVTGAARRSNIRAARRLASWAVSRFGVRF
jgi:uncharacterized HAD superfamily protein/adenine/guanine phosphoribosyltransferase-like PRPP-binding protein